MPAITIALNEIQRRLSALQRRLNLVTLQHGLYLGGSVVILSAAGLILAGLRASVTSFRIAAWGAASLALATVAACLVFLRLRWLDAQATAHLVDRRAELTDRLATIVALCPRPRASRLAPVVIAQTLGLGARWQPQQIAPRPVPRSIFLLLASLLALAFTVLIGRHEPRPTSPVVPAGFAAGPVDDSALREPSQAGAGNEAAGNAAAQASSAQPSLRSLSGAQPLGPGEAATSAPGDLPSQPKAGTALASLPDRLQEAIRHAFHAETVGAPHELAAQPQSRTGDDRGESEHTAGSDPQRKTEDQQGTSGKENPASASGSQKRTGKSESGEHLPQRQESAARDQRLDGHAPAAGDGSSPGSLMDPKAPGLALGSEGPKTFKLTITSFLRAAEQQSTQPREPGKRAGVTGSAGSASGEQVAPSDRQLTDDALRKAEVPPEYEDIVRRVYSARASQ
jgi:hypothetical protein